VHEIRLHDPGRRPVSWTEIVRPEELAVFAKHVESGATLDADGNPFARPSEATCLVFDSLAEAESFCRERIARHPFLRFEIFEGHARTAPPLVVLVGDPYRRKLPADEWAMRMRSRAATALLVGALPLVWFDWWASGGVFVLPTLIALNMIVVAARLFHLNLGARSAEKARQARVARYFASGSSAGGKSS
jgi:hypothetical protein